MIDIAVLGLAVVAYFAIVGFRIKQFKPRNDGLITDFIEVLK